MSLRDRGREKGGRAKGRASEGKETPKITKEPMAENAQGTAETNAEKCQRLSKELMESACNVGEWPLGSWRAAMREIREMVNRKESIEPLVPMLGVTLALDREIDMKTEANYFLAAWAAYGNPISPAYNGVLKALFDESEIVSIGALTVLGTAHMHGADINFAKDDVLRFTKRHDIERSSIANGRQLLAEMSQT